MSISRRQFILGTAAGLILPSYYEKVFSYFENHGEPLLEIPKQASIDLYAHTWESGEIDFNLGEVVKEPPIPMTVREFARRYYGGEQGYLDNFSYADDGSDINFDEDESEEMVMTAFLRNDSPSAKAYRLLDNLDLGPDLDSDDAVGHLEFLDAPSMCWDYLGVQPEDHVSISLLQKRLNELNTGIRISMA